jgi:hypothetical protein
MAAEIWDNEKTVSNEYWFVGFKKQNPTYIKTISA